MPILEAIGNAIGQFIGKVIAVGGVGILAAAGIAAITAIEATLNATPDITIYAVIVVGAAVVWQKGIVPLVIALLEGVQPKTTSVAKANRSTSVRDYLSFGNW